MNIYWESLATISGLLIAEEDKKEKHKEAIKVLKRATKCPSIAISRYNPFTKMHRTFCSVGYDEKTLNHLNDWFVKYDRIYNYMKLVDNRPLRWKEMPFPYRETFSAKNIFIPAGYDEGVTVCLYNYRNEYTGALHISSSHKGFPDDESMNLIHSMQNIIGSSIDIFSKAKSLDPIFSIIYEKDQNEDFIEYTNKNHPIASDFSEKLIKIDIKHLPKKFYYFFDNECFAIYKSSFEHLIMINAFKTKPPFLLTPRELEVCTLMMKGLTNNEIGAFLGISRRTTSHHVSNIIKKLQVKSRTQAAVKIQTESLTTLHSMKNQAILNS